MMFAVELLGKMIYLCNELLIEKSLFKFQENIYVCKFWEFLFWYVIWKISGIEVGQRNFLYCQFHHLKNWGTNPKSSKIKTYDNFPVYFGVIMWVKKYAIIFISGFGMNFRFLFILIIYD